MRNLWIAGALALYSSTTFAQWNFSTCGATGATGPTQAACDAAYASTNLAGNVTVTAGIQSWTVPATGVYRITAVGGQGASGAPNYVGGKGAELTGEFTLSAGTTLNIAVGQQGLGQGSIQNGGGGGGSFVVGISNVPMLVAGGGGGTRYAAAQNGCNASLTEYGVTGVPGYTTSLCLPKTSSLRQGGMISAITWGSAGAGFDTNGESDVDRGTGGSSWFNGLSGGVGLNLSYSNDAQGGFGGGGAGNGSYGGGGGGGYSGGDSGLIAGGAGSFNVGANPTAVISTGSGDGRVDIVQLLVINEVTLPVGQISSVYPAMPLSATGGTGPFSWSATGLPNGMSLSSAGVLTGTPIQHGSFSVQVTVTDSSATPLTHTTTLPLTINPAPLALNTTSLAPATIGTPYTQTIVATGGITPYNWSATGLPADLTINPATGIISGTPTAAGTSQVTVTVTDDAGQVKTAQITIVVDPLDLSVSNQTLPGGQVGQAYSASIVVAGGVAPYTFTLTGDLPEGLTLNPTTGAITGTPTKAQTSTFSITIEDSTLLPPSAMAKAAVHSVTQSFSITVAAAPVVAAPTPVPTLNDWGLLLLSVLTIGAAGFFTRKRTAE